MAEMLQVLKTLTFRGFVLEHPDNTLSSTTDQGANDQDNQGRLLCRLNWISNNCKTDQKTERKVHGDALNCENVLPAT